MKKYTFLLALLSLPFFVVAQSTSDRTERAEQQTIEQRDRMEVDNFKMLVMRFEEACKINDAKSIAVLKADLEQAMQTEIAQAKNGEAKRQAALLEQFSAAKAGSNNAILHEFLQLMAKQRG